MFRVSCNDIAMTRGDTVILNLGVKNYNLEEGDNVVLTVKKNIHSADVLFQKQLNSEKKQFIIEPSDTSSLAYGKYKYDVQITTADGKVYTVVTPHDFTIEGEVSW